MVDHKFAAIQRHILQQWHVGFNVDINGWKQLATKADSSTNNIWAPLRLEYENGLISLRSDHNVLCHIKSHNRGAQGDNQSSRFPLHPDAGEQNRRCARPQHPCGYRVRAQDTAWLDSPVRCALQFRRASMRRVTRPAASGEPSAI